MSEHIVPKKIYFFVFGTLIALTALTTSVAFIDLGPINTVAALAIAVCKATLVVLFFMHLRWSGHLMRMVMVAALFWLAILITLTLSDVFTRNWTPIPAGWETPGAFSRPSFPASPTRLAQTFRGLRGRAVRPYCLPLNAFWFSNGHSPRIRDRAKNVTDPSTKTAAAKSNDFRAELPRI